MYQSMLSFHNDAYEGEKKIVMPNHGGCSLGEFLLEKNLEPTVLRVRKKEVELHSTDLPIHRFHRFANDAVAISLPIELINGRDMLDALFPKVEFRLLSDDNRIAVYWRTSLTD
jgi:hypothetical protein